MSEKRRRSSGSPPAEPVPAPKRTRKNERIVPLVAYDVQHMEPMDTSMDDANSERDSDINDLPTFPVEIPPRDTYAAQAPSSFRFLDLPERIRWKVYELVIPAGYHKLRCPAITQVNRLVRAESSPRVYRDSSFHFIGDWDEIQNWRDKMDAVNISLVNDASVEVGLIELNAVGDTSSQRATRGSQYVVRAWLTNKESWGYEKMIVEFGLKNGGLVRPLQKNGGYAERFKCTVSGFNMCRKYGLTGHDLVELLWRFQVHYGKPIDETPWGPEIHFKETRGYDLLYFEVERDDCELDRKQQSQSPCWWRPFWHIHQWGIEKAHEQRWECLGYVDE